MDRIRENHIRQMRDEDTQAICQVEAQAFGNWWKQLTGQKTPLHRRTHTNIQVCREKDPEGCFIAEVEDRLVGFIFSRTWGNVGWFGTFSVLPEFQGHGIGKQLIDASLGYLRAAGVQIIGLETMPESPYNLGLYLKQGFRSRLLTFLFKKSLDKSAAAVELPCWSEADQQTRNRWVVRLREASMQIPPGFDYSKEIISTTQHDQGETLVLSDNRGAFGMSTVLLKDQRQGAGGEYAVVQALVLHPAYTSIKSFHTLLHASETLAEAHGRQELLIPVNARHNWVVEQLLEYGYQVERAMVRMTLDGMEEEPLADEWVNCSRWAG